MESEVCSVASGPSIHFAPSVATSATSHDWEMRSASPAPSMYSVTSSLRAASYRHEFGRGINNYSEVYRLPADDEEFERLGTYTRWPLFLPRFNNDGADRKSTRLNSSHSGESRMPSSA